MTTTDRNGFERRLLSQAAFLSSQCISSMLERQNRSQTPVVPEVLSVAVRPAGRA